MSQEKSQNYQNHGHLPKWFFAQCVLSLLALGILSYAAFVASGEGAGFFLGLGALIVAVNQVTIFMHLRLNFLLVQDRLIRLETQTRLYRILPPELQAHIPQLSLPQLIALRFESDANLPALVKKVVDENITDRANIKKLVKDWQADWMRV